MDCPLRAQTRVLESLRWLGMTSQGIWHSIRAMRWFSLLRSAIYASVFIALQMWFFPRWAGLLGSWNAPMAEPWRWAGTVPLVMGSIIMIACVFRFGTTGEGTPFPADPPRKFVAVGPYRWSRNPMYVGMALALIGEAVLFADWSQWERMAVYFAVLAAITECFVVFYEEPTLRKKFGAEYEEHCRRVPRWIFSRRSAQMNAEQTEGPSTRSARSG
jgi:protein-S-isoprenylcysteine O-methyltransferase Ste14